MIAVSMLHAAGFVVRPVLTAEMDAYSIFGLPVEAYIPGSSPVPAATGLVVADEKGLEAEIVAAFVAQLAKVGGELRRVALLSVPRSQGPLDGLFGGGDDEDRRGREAATLEACGRAGAECTVIRTGSLRGGGSASDSEHNLGKEFYARIVDSISSLEEELFDMNQRGIDMSAAGASGGGGFGGLFGAKQETARCTAAAALAEALGAEAAAGKVVDVFSAEGAASPTAAEWAEAFAAVAQSPASQAVAAE